MTTQETLNMWKREAELQETRCEELQTILTKALALLGAVKSDAYDGIYCVDINGQNWFDQRDAMIKF